MAASDYVTIAFYMLGAGVAIECIVIIIGYVIRFVLRMLGKGGS